MFRLPIPFLGKADLYRFSRIYAILSLIMRRIAFIFLLALISSSIAFSQSGKMEKAKIDIRKVMDEQVAAWNSGDIDGFMKGYWNSPDLVFVSGENLTKGWQPTLDRYKKNYDSRSKMGILAFSDLEIEPLSKDSAKVIGKWALKREKDEPKGRFTLIFRKFKDGWRIIHDHTS
jgi:ketosteroid isomerase-like protein